MFKDKKMAAVGILSVSLFLLLLALTTPGTASAASAYFIKIDGIPGASIDDKHPGWIVAASWSVGVTQPVTAGTPAGRVPKFQDFKFTKMTDKASPKLFVACADGTHIREVLLEVCRADADKVKFFEIKLSNVIVSGFSNSGSAQAYPMEEISLNYGRIEVRYLEQRRADGTGGGTIAGGWDLTLNKPIR